MTKRKGQNKLWWFISWLQVILLALPILNVIYRVVDYSVVAWSEQQITESSDGHIAVLNNVSFAKELNNALVYTYFDFSAPYNYDYDQEVSNAHTFWGLDDFGGTYTSSWENFYNECRLYDYNLTHFDFCALVITEEYGEYRAYGSWILPLFFNWYMNYIITVLVAFFIPYLLVFIFSWFTSFAEGFINKSTKGED